MRSIMSRDKLTAYLPYAGIPFLAAAALVIYAAKLDILALLRYELILVLGYVAAINDLKTKRIPNRLILVMLGAWTVMTILHVFIDTGSAIGALIFSALGFAVGGGLFLFVFLISRKGLGGGDVKLMACAGLYLGFTGVITVMLWGTVIAAITGLVLILAKKIGRKDTIPLAPFLYLGVLIVVFVS